MRYGNFLQDGGTIGFVAPSFGCNIEPYRSGFDHALSRFRSMGYGIWTGPNVYEGSGIGISNSPDLCADEFMDAYCGDQADVIISCGGGELMCGILPYVDFDKIASSDPKWFMGYSDNTNLTFLLPTLADTAAIYGPCAAPFGIDPWHESIRDAFEVITGKKREVSNYPMWEKESLKDEEHPLVPYNLTEAFHMQCLPEGNSRFSGRLLGGCLDILQILCGTKYDRVKEFNDRYQDDGVIWFLESCDLTVMAMRRAVWQLREAGWFEKARGFLVGRPWHYREDMMGLDQYQAVTGVLEELGVPIIMDLDIGHLPPMMPLISGSLAQAEVRDGRFHLSMDLV